MACLFLTGELVVDAALHVGVSGYELVCVVIAAWSVHDFIISLTWAFGFWLPLPGLHFFWTVSPVGAVGVGHSDKLGVRLDILAIAAALSIGGFRRV